MLRSLLRVSIFALIAVPGAAHAERWCALERNGVCLEWRGEEDDNRTVDPPQLTPNDPPQISKDEQIERALGLSSSDRREIQRALTSMGYNTRGIDGLFGPGTRGAIRNWQRRKGYRQTGYLTRSQRDLLMASAPSGGSDTAALRRRIAGNTLRYWWSSPPTTYSHFTRSGKVAHRKRSGEILEGSWKILEVGGEPALCTWYDVTGNSRFCYHFAAEGNRQKLIHAEGSKKGQRSRGVSILNGDPKGLARHVR